MVRFLLFVASALGADDSQKRRLDTGGDSVGLLCFESSPLQPTLAALGGQEAEPAASLRLTQVSNTFSLRGDGTVCSCIKGAYMGCSKLLNPQSSQFTNTN